MRLQRVRGAESRVEMQTDKWTIEGAVKSSFRVLRLESILQRNVCVRGEGCDGILLECARNSETRWYRRYSILWPVLDMFEDGSFILSSLPPF